MSLKFKHIEHNSDLYRDTVALRHRILREPLGLKFDPAELAAESDVFHLACYDSGVLVGCLILEPQSHVMKMRQVAVSEQSRGLGVGRLLVEFSEQFAREQGYTKMVLNARETAVGFYSKLDYLVQGEPFEEVTIPHRAMFKKL